MANPSPADEILEFLRMNKFTKAEAALRTELGSRSDLNGILQNLKIDETKLCTSSTERVNGAEELDDESKKNYDPSAKGLEGFNSGETSGELIVKEVECGERRNGSDNKWKNFGTIREQGMIDASVGTNDNDFTFFEGSDDAVVDLYSSKHSMSDGLVPLIPNDLGFKVSNNRKPLKDGSVFGENRISKVTTEPKDVRRDKLEHKEHGQDRKLASTCSKDNFADIPCPIRDVFAASSSENWKDFSVETMFPVLRTDMPSGHGGATIIGKREGKGKTQLGDVKAEMKDQVNDVGRVFYFGKSQGSEVKHCGPLALHPAAENQKEELPRLAPVRLKFEDKSANIHTKEKYVSSGGPDLKMQDAETPYVIGSCLDVPFGQEISLSGKRPGGGSWLSVSQGIAEGTSDLISGFATIGDGLSESIDFPNEYWDSDEYEDDDDVGYTRQPIEDETWFLAHEIDYPSDNEKGTGHSSFPDTQEHERNKDNEEDQSFTEGDSYLSGQQYFQSTNVNHIISSGDPGGFSATEIYRRNNVNEVVGQYNGRLMDEEEVNLLCSEPTWQGFRTETDDFMLGNEKVIGQCGRPRMDYPGVDDDPHDSVRSIGVGVSSDAADIGSEARESLIGDIEYFHDHDARIGRSMGYSRHNLGKDTIEQTLNHNNRINRYNSDISMTNNDKDTFTPVNPSDGFSFPPPRDGQSVETISNKADGFEVANTDMLTHRWRKNSESVLVKSSRDENYANSGESRDSSPSSLSNSGYSEREHGEAAAHKENPESSLEDDEAAAVQDQVKQIKAQEEEFETFNLKIVHRKNRTGFEEDKNFHVTLNSVIAGRYHVTEYLGSAAFSKAIQAHDLHTSMDVCMKIIKNNKDFFDQSLDEIKLLKYVNKHDPADKYHLLRLYDYFYYREHLLIVCELLKANLYEFQKFNRESGGEVYFTMPRLQSITIQCLEALQFLHSLGLIHCDLKPENILVKSYSRCEVKVIDLGSSCFETDNLCTYVQSRSYRAPEVILGLPYDKKIDIWSLGCILAELCTGNVLFQNDSPATLLARVIGIINPIEAEMLAKGRETHKYFTKSHMLYERSQETNKLEYLIPKKSSLSHRLPMGDQGFVDFVAHLLEVNPEKRASASEALKHPWLQYPYEPLSP